jgi:hypothetical protein
LGVFSTAEAAVVVVVSVTPWAEVRFTAVALEVTAIVKREVFQFMAATAETETVRAINPAAAGVVLVFPTATALTAVLAASS